MPDHPSAAASVGRRRHTASADERCLRSGTRWGMPPRCRTTGVVVTGSVFTLGRQFDRWMDRSTASLLPELCVLAPCPRRGLTHLCLGGLSSHDLAAGQEPFSRHRRLFESDRLPVRSDIPGSLLGSVADTIVVTAVTRKSFRRGRSVMDGGPRDRRDPVWRGPSRPDPDRHGAVRTSKSARPRPGMGSRSGKAPRSSGAAASTWRQGQRAASGTGGSGLVPATCGRTTMRAPEPTPRRVARPRGPPPSRPSPRYLTSHHVPPLPIVLGTGRRSRYPPPRLRMTQASQGRRRRWRSRQRSGDRHRRGVHLRGVRDPQRRQSRRLRRGRRYGQLISSDSWWSFAYRSPSCTRSSRPRPSHWTANRQGPRIRQNASGLDRADPRRSWLRVVG